MNVIEENNKRDNPYLGLIEPKDYKYKELCLAFNENAKTGNAKKAQLKRFSQYIAWENPTSHIFRVTEVYNTIMGVDDGRKNNGGVRANAGKRFSLQEEFDYLFNAFLNREFDRNAYNVQPKLCTAYFSSTEISKYFGMFGNDWYYSKYNFRQELKKRGVIDDYKLDSAAERFFDAWKAVNRKIVEKRRSWIYNRIKKIDGISLSDGIMAYIYKKEVDEDGDFLGYVKDEYGREVIEEVVYPDSFLDEWNEIEERYLKEHKYKTIADACEAGQYNEMIMYIMSGLREKNKKAKVYDKIVKAKKIEYDVSMLKEYELGEIGDCRKRFNDKLVEELLAFFRKKVDNDSDFKMYEMVIENHVRL